MYSCLSPPTANLDLTQRTPETSPRQEQFEWWAHLVGALRVHPHKHWADHPPQKDRGTADCSHVLHFSEVCHGLSAGEGLPL